METKTIIDFYKEIADKTECKLDFLSHKNYTDLGQFNVFDIHNFYHGSNKRCNMTYNRRLYYKISLIRGKNVVEYANRVVRIEKQGILFATPRIPYRYTSHDDKQSGMFCVFTKDFISKAKTGIRIEDLPIYKSNGDLVYQLDDEQFTRFEAVFRKMEAELKSDYAYKYDLIRNYVMEIIHTGQKLIPMDSRVENLNASGRITSLFIELLERQFPIELEDQTMTLRAANDFANQLGVHINHLNKVLRETTGRSTTEIIHGRIAEEAKILLKQTQWNVSQIAYALGFDEIAHFSNFFKKHTSLSPLKFRID